MADTFIFIGAMTTLAAFIGACFGLIQLIIWFEQLHRSHKWVEKNRYKIDRFLAEKGDK